MSNTDDLALTADEQFFYDNAGWSYNPLTESSREGRARCARERAAAEAWATANGYRMEWGLDEDHDHSYLGDGECPDTCELAVLWGPDDDIEGEPRASLGCIDDADDAYRRVVAAELALEVMASVLNG